MNWKTRFKLSAAFKPLNTLLRIWKRLQWRLTGSALPPLHEIKQSHLISLRQRFAPRVFVETGTYRGKMIFAMRPYFDQVISIEVDPRVELISILPRSDSIPLCPPDPLAYRTFSRAKLWSSAATVTSRHWPSCASAPRDM